MKTSELVNNIKTKFYAKLETKTGWGKNELRLMFDMIILEALAEYVDDKEKQIEDNKKFMDNDDHYRNMIDGVNDWRD